ncbi:MAG TPA: hypothetical protein VGK30_20000 [Candidatus Binatia bacterium]|jgi:hypothetical protein
MRHRRFATALAGLALCALMVGPARADDHDHWRHGHRRYEHHGTVHAYRPYYYRSYRYEPGGYYYTPPPLYVEPPPPSFGLNLVFPFHFH